MATSSNPHLDQLGAIGQEQQRQRTSEQHDNLDVQEAVLTRPELLKDVLHLTGPGQHFYVSTVCIGWRAAYKQALQGLRNSRHYRVKPTLTSYAAVFSSLSRLQLAVEYGFTEILSDGRVQQAAGQYADMEILHLAGSLGILRKNSHFTPGIIRGAALSGSLQKVQSLVGHEPSQLLRGISHYAIRGGSMEMLEWMSEQGAEFDRYAMWSAVEFGHVNMLQYMKERGSPLEHSLTGTAAYHGQFAALQWLIAEGCGHNVASIGDSAATAGCVAMMRWLSAELGV